MIDIHHHCLPALDDGPRELEEAVALCRQSADEGISTIVCTPHVLRGRWQNDSRQVLEAAMSRLQDALGGAPPQLLLGSEYFFAHDITEVLESGRGIVPLAGSRYVLVEFAAHVVPPMVEQPLYRMQLGGWIPVIAHPERNSIFQAKPELLASLVSLGAKVQVTAASFLGDFGADAERVAKELLERELVHVVATDAHNLTRRPPRAYAAREAVTRLAGAARAEALFVTNPAAIVRNDGLVYDPDLPYTAAPAAGWFGRLRKLLNQ